jgi:hypothetical protein
MAVSAGAIYKGDSGHGLAWLAAGVVCPCMGCRLAEVVVKGRSGQHLGARMAFPQSAARAKMPCLYLIVRTNMDSHTVK